MDRKELSCAGVPHCRIPDHPPATAGAGATNVPALQMWKPGLGRGGDLPKGRTPILRPFSEPLCCSDSASEPGKGQKDLAGGMRDAGTVDQDELPSGPSSLRGSDHRVSVGLLLLPTHRPLSIPS